METFRRIRNISLIITIVSICALSAFGQTPDILPSNLAGAGMGFQSIATPQVSGWAEYCHRNPDIPLLGMSVPSLTCGATDYSGVVTSGRVEADTVLLHRSWFAVGTKTGAGAAYNVNGVGGSFSGGAWGAMLVEKWLKIPGAVMLASATWQKDDVMVAAAQPTARVQFTTLATRGVFRFGFGKVW